MARTLTDQQARELIALAREPQPQVIVPVSLLRAVAFTLDALFALLDARDTETATDDAKDRAGELPGQTSVEDFLGGDAA